MLGLFILVMNIVLIFLVNIIFLFFTILFSIILLFKSKKDFKKYNTKKLG